MRDATEVREWKPTTGQMVAGSALSAAVIVGAFSKRLLWPLLSESARQGLIDVSFVLSHCSYVCGFVTLGWFACRGVVSYLDPSMFRPWNSAQRYVVLMLGLSFSLAGLVLDATTAAMRAAL